MKIMVLNGCPDDQEYPMSQPLYAFQQQLENLGHQVHTVDLRLLTIDQCRGCFGCWLKTPGECLIDDDSHDLCRQIMQSDLVIFATPAIMGFPSALTKKTMEKMIPLIHPYIELVNGECHHRARYRRYPKLGLLLFPEEDFSEKDWIIVKDIFQRFSINLRSQVLFASLYDHELTEVFHEMGRV